MHFFFLFFPLLYSTLVLIVLKLCKLQVKIGNFLQDSVSPSLPKQALRCASFLCWQQLGWLQHAHLYQTPTVLRSCHSLFLKAATDNNTRGWDLGVKR